MSKRFWVRLLLPVGDLALLYGALWATLVLRYGATKSEFLWQLHRAPFSLIFAVLLLSFFIAGLYDLRMLAPGRRANILFFRTMLVGGGIAILLFYLVPAWKITPRLNLFIHLSLSTILLFLWHWAVSWVLARLTNINVLFLDNSKEATELMSLIETQPQLGYRLVSGSIEYLKEMLKANRLDLIIASSNNYQDPRFQKIIFDIVPYIQCVNVADFYEDLNGKVPVSLISGVWFLENLTEGRRNLFEAAKRTSDVVLAILFLLPALFMTPFIVLLIKTTSSGPVFYHQRRVGKRGHVFSMIKFRSMRENAETNGATWATADDKRITYVGNLLRKTRLDELPQLWNILKGDMSFIGPRPERPEFVESLKQKLPFYQIRHIVRPGLSGWAQINFPYGASLQDALEKLQYDLYYIKHRSFWLDLVITLKTFKVLLSRAGR